MSEGETQVHAHQQKSHVFHMFSRSDPANGHPRFPLPLAAICLGLTIGCSGTPNAPTAVPPASQTVPAADGSTGAPVGLAGCLGDSAAASCFGGARVAAAAVAG